MKLRLLPPRFPKRVTNNLHGFETTMLCEYYRVRHATKILDLAISQPHYKRLIPYPEFGESTCYIVPCKQWIGDEADDNRLLLNILEHETIHDILAQQNINDSIQFDSLFNCEPGHVLALTELNPY